MIAFTPSQPAPMPCITPARRFVPDPKLPTGQTDRTAVLLCNLGTPDAPTPSAVRRYLAEFLHDDRIVELPRTLWLPLLHGLILRLRPRASAAKYATIWNSHGTTGSPLLHWTARQAQLLQTQFAAAGDSQVLVDFGMRYGTPAIPARLNALKAQGAARILILPLYPQYSGTTVASVCDTVYAWAKTQRHIPELRFIHRYHDDPGYIQALAHSVQRHWAQHGQAQQLILSFHGTPERLRQQGDPYHDECHTTARLLAAHLQLGPQQYIVTFQSRFGRAPWLQPYTQPTLAGLPATGIRSVDVLCPGFASDCVETLEEINDEVRTTFLQAGGESFHFIPCLNDNPDWITALHNLALQHLQGWRTR